MRLHAVTSTFILCKPEVVGSNPIVSTTCSRALRLLPRGPLFSRSLVSPSPLPSLLYRYL